MRCCGRLRRLALAAGVALGAALGGVPARAAEPPPGTANFTPPSYVPDYFSNESGPFRGSAAAHANAPAASPALAAPSPQHPVAVAAHHPARYRHAHTAKAQRYHRRPGRRRAAAHHHAAGVRVASRGKAWHAAPTHRRHTAPRHAAARHRAAATHNRAAPAKGKRFARARG